ncbi:MAG TPA: hypothetical protein VK922_05600 [Gemmatimonadaceae bacterium]|nr:hypothetical protein [Gemmatimonadaceae bacterium]
MSRAKSKTPSLPEAPEIDRRITIPPFRAAALGVIVLVPVLAVLGVFGERARAGAAASGAIAVQIEFPSRARFRALDVITATVANRSDGVIDTVTVRIDTAYALRFSAVTFTPPATAAYGVKLTSLGPGESRLVVVELRGERYGRHRGALHVESTSGDTVAIAVHTWTFP